MSVCLSVCVCALNVIFKSELNNGVIERWPVAMVGHRRQISGQLRLNAADAVYWYSDNNVHWLYGRFG